MLMLGCRRISSPAALTPPPTNMTDLLGTECYGLWENEALSSGKLDSSDIMELIDSSNSTNNSAAMIASMSPCSSSPSSSPSSIILHDQCQSQSCEMLTPVSTDHYSHQQLGMMHSQSQQQANHDASSNNQTPYSQYITPLPALMMSNDDPYSPTDVQLLEPFNCMDGTDFHKLNDNFADSYENFLSEEPHHHHLHSMPGVNLNNHHHQLSGLENGQHQLHNQNQQNHHGMGPQSNGPDGHLLGLNSAYQFNEPSLSIAQHQSNHSQHQHVATSSATFQQFRGHEYNNNSWEEPGYYGADFRFSCKGESPATSDSVSYTSVDSGVGSSKSSTDSISVSAFNSGHKLVPPKRRVGRPPKKDKKQKKLEKKTGRLWEFIRDLLKNPEYCPSLVRWENPEEGHFRFVNSDQVAKLWGRLKGNPRMTYEKLSRAMRYYYKSKVFEPVLGRRLVYKFGFNATNWRPTNPNFSQKVFC